MDEAERLRGALSSLRGRYDRVRVVTYSLGCRLIMHACPPMSHTSRPYEVHLLAAAVQVSEAEPLLMRGIAQGKTHLYYSPDDKVLRLLFSAAEGAPAMGFHGLTQQQIQLLEKEVEQHNSSELVARRVSSWDPLAVHLMYSALWGDIVCAAGSANIRAAIDKG